MKKQTSRKAVTSRADVALAPVAQHSGGYFFTNRMACAECGKDPNYNKPQGEPDEYNRTLIDHVAKVLHHAKYEVLSGTMFSAMETAGMLRDCARMMDIVEARRRARRNAEDAAKARRKGAVMKSAGSSRKTRPGMAPRVTGILNIFCRGDGWGDGGVTRADTGCYKLAQRLGM